MPDKILVGHGATSNVFPDDFVVSQAVASTIRSFPREKAIVAKEIASNMYRTFPYFIGKALSEVPLVGVFNSIFKIDHKKNSKMH